MHGRPAHHDSDGPVAASHPQRWQILGVLVLSLLVTSIDHTIINVALPQMVNDLDASAAAAPVDRRRLHRRVRRAAPHRRKPRGPLRPPPRARRRARHVHGRLGAQRRRRHHHDADRRPRGHGPRRGADHADDPVDPRQRLRRPAGAGHGHRHLDRRRRCRHRARPDRRRLPHARPLLVVGVLDQRAAPGRRASSGRCTSSPTPRTRTPPGSTPSARVASTVAVGSLVYAIIDAPEHGWTSPPTLLTFAVAAIAGVTFVRWELRRDEPMLDMRLFANRSFSAGSVALAMLFFAMAGTVFLQAQYLQFVLGYTPLAAGVALVPAAVGMMLGTGVGAHLAGQLGGRIAVTAGTLAAAAGVAVQAAFVDGTSYVPTGVGLALFGLGAGIAMPAATELIMSTLPPARAGVGSAVNDTVREVGGALGVAVIGSVAASSYASNLHGQVDHLPADVRAVVTDNIGAALTRQQPPRRQRRPARRTPLARRSSPR